MLNEAAINQIIGAATAGLIGVFTALFLKWVDDRRRRKSVARAILNEMIQTINSLMVALPILERAAEVKDTALNRTVEHNQLKRMRPFDRKVFSSLGEHLGSLSDRALSNTVFFDGTMQALDRRFDDFWYGELDGMVRNESCHQIASAIRHALSLSRQNVNAVLWDAHGPRWKTPTQTLALIDQLDGLLEGGGMLTRRDDHGEPFCPATSG